MLFQWAWPSFVQTETPFNKGCFLLKLVEIVPMALEKKIKIRKVPDDDIDEHRTNFNQKTSESLEPYLKWELTLT